MCVCALFISDVPVSPTGRDWQPVRISSWWWCICWNETLSPAPVSDGLYKLLCTSPSFLFYLQSRQKTHITISQFSRVLAFFFPILNLSVYIVAGRLLNWKIPTVETGMPERAYLHTASLSVCFSNLHLFCFRNANWAVLSCVYNCRTVNFKEAAITSFTVTSREA